MRDLFDRLTKLQNELHAPKSQFNKFGKYNYRNCEDILEAVKPLLLTHSLALTINDEIVQIGERFYVKATATLRVTTEDTPEQISNTAYARESVDKKGMDDAQVTGATSSYARKYALNGLFLIDDTKDADSMDNSEQVAPAAPVNPPSINQQQSDDKEWYNDFENHKQIMIDKINSGESTPKDIISKLRQMFKVSKQVATKIEDLK